MIESWRVERWRRDVLLMLQPKHPVSAGRLVAAHVVTDHRTPYTAIIRVLRSMRDDGLVALAPGGRGWVLTPRGREARKAAMAAGRGCASCGAPAKAGGPCPACHATIAHWGA